jgi:hypothetical protein
VRISRLLLESLLILNKNDIDVSIYLLDLGLDNIAYNELTDRVFFIDLENVVFVDKASLVDYKNASSVYSMPFDNCGGQNTDCLAYNVNSMCTKKHVDINFYSGLYFVV